MLEQAENRPPQQVVIGQEIIGLDRKIIRLSGGRPIRRLSLEEQQRLGELFSKKNRLIIQTLELRKQGQAGITVVLSGSPTDQLKPHSHNFLTVTIENQIGHKKCSTRAPFMKLQEVYSGDLRELVGEIDGFVPESREQSIVRTITETNWLSFHLDYVRKEKDKDKVEELSKLKVAMGEHLLEERVLGNIGAGKIAVYYLRGRDDKDIIEINFFPERGRITGCHFLAPRFYKFPNRLQELINQSGGYDRIADRMEFQVSS